MCSDNIYMMQQRANDKTMMRVFFNVKNATFFLRLHSEKPKFTLLVKINKLHFSH